jgi:hypothetical protein
MIQSPIKSPQPAISQPSASRGQNTILRANAILLSCTAIIEKSHNPPATLERIVENETKPISQEPKAKERANGPAATSRSDALRRPHLHRTENGETRKATRNRLAIVHSSRLPRCQGRKKERKRSEPGIIVLAATPLQLSWLFRLCRACGMAKRLIACSLELSCGEWAFLFWCQLNVLHILPGF